MKRYGWLLAFMAVVVLGAGLLLSGCGGDTTTTTGGTGSTTESTAPPATEEDTAANTFTFAQGADPRGLDPARVDDGESAKVIVEHLRGSD